MTAPTESEQAVARASAPMSIGAVAVGLLGTALGVVAAACHYQFAAEFFLWAALAGLMGIATARIEQVTPTASVCLGLAVAVSAGNLLVAWFAYNAIPANIILVTIFVLIAFMTPVLAVQIQRNTISVLAFLLNIWLLPVALLTGISVMSVIIEREQFKPRLAAGFTLSLPFGPWATQVLRVVSFPNAGEGFNLPSALAFTAVLGTLVYIILRRPRIANYCLIPYAWLMIGWYAISLGQIMRCLS